MQCVPFEPCRCWLSRANIHARRSGLLAEGQPGMSRPFSQTLTRFREKLASNQAQSSPDYLSLYSDRARPIESQFEFSRIVLILIFLVCLFGTPSACGARQASADPSETRLAEGIKLLGEGRHLEFGAGGAHARCRLRSRGSGPLGT